MGDEVRPRLLFSGGSLVAALGVLVTATGRVARGFVYIVIGMAVIGVGARMAQSLTGGEQADYTAWYTAGLGLALMGGGAAVTLPARDAGTGGGQVVLFLGAGVLLWMGVTCLIAAAVRTRRAAAR
jgi:peptidoglycan/LPS O-acetylase OafA/YrhL